MMGANQLFINGDWTAATSTATWTVVNPHDEQPLGTAAIATGDDVDRAVRAASAALGRDEWASLTPPDRSALLTRLAEELKTRATDLAALITDETGTPSSWSLFGQVYAGIMTLEYYARLAAEYPFEDARMGMLGECRVRNEPVGVCAAIVPWNAPFFTTAMKLGPALAAGCTVVVKPALETPLDAFILADAAAAAGIPPGVLNIVTGDAATGAALVEHPLIDKVAFTGSTAVGVRIAEACATRLARVTLELGGKSAAVVLDDADLDEVVETLIPGASLPINGQACAAHTRVLAPRRRYHEVVDRLATAVRSLVVGDPRDAATQIGPMVTARHRDRVLGYIRKGHEEGAKPAAGGSAEPLTERGWYVEPTLFVDVDPGMVIAQEEIFGPILVVIPHNGDDDALRIADDTRFGLSGSVWSADAHRAYDFACRVRAGTFMVNSFGMDLGCPFGGVKQSGIGRELGPEGLAAYLEPKSIQLPFGFT